MKKSSGALCTIYHNPRCSKSRATLALLRERGLKPRVIEYLNTPPSVTELQSLLTKLAMRPGEILRKGEEAYKLELQGKDLTDAQLLGAMTAHPVLIERPIVVVGDRAALGRPPENVLQLFD